MASAELQKLHKLFLVDSAILEIRKRAAALDTGQKLASEIKILESRAENCEAKRLQREFNDLELQQGGLEEKQRRHEKDLYGGKVVNPREVELIEKEIAHLKTARAEIDDQLLKIMEALPAAKAEEDKIADQIVSRKRILVTTQKSALEEKSRLEIEFKEKSAKRPELAKDVSPTLMARYDAIRQKHGGVGMAEVNRKTQTCGGCGTTLPERTIEALKEDKTVTCESCHRILYYSEGVI
jgi:predicted  nucleic acid-binding Zn-ribbon protein